MTDTKALFKACWDYQIADQQKRTPDYKPEEYTANGKAPAAYGGKRTIQWWLDHGHEYVDRWIDWRMNNPKWRPWEIDGVPAIELELSFMLPGDIPVYGFIDRVEVTPSGELAVVDIKSGRLPETPEQLGLYACGVEILHGVRPSWGFYWDATKGELSRPYDLDFYTPDYMAALYREAIAGINAGSFMAKPANNCGAWCGVAQFCSAVGGHLAHKHDPILLNLS